MYLLALLVLTPILLPGVQSDCPESIATEVLTDYADLMGLWYNAYVWGNGRSKRHARLSCYSIQVQEISPAEIQARRTECLSSGVNYDWDNVILKFVITELPGEPPRLISRAPGSTHMSMLDHCTASDQVIRGVAGSNEYMLSVSDSVAVLLTRHVPDVDTLNCLAVKLDIVEDYGWSAPQCS